MLNLTEEDITMIDLTRGSWLQNQPAHGGSIKAPTKLRKRRFIVCVYKLKNDMLNLTEENITMTNLTRGSRF